jgi:hypothetical protein
VFGRYRTVPFVSWFVSTGCCLCLHAGSYSSLNQSTACTNCEPGFFQSQTGATFCGQCGEGEFAPQSGSPACSLCTSGSVYANFTKCGTVSCPAGTAALSGSGACQSCPVGSYAAANSTVCFACAVNTFAPNTGSSACSVCSDPGLFWCVPCIASSSYTVCVTMFSQSWRRRLRSARILGVRGCTGLSYSGLSSWILRRWSNRTSCMRSESCSGSKQRAVRRVHSGVNECAWSVHTYVDLSVKSFSSANFVVVISACSSPNGGRIALAFILAWLVVLILHALSQGQTSETSGFSVCSSFLFLTRLID